MIQSPCPGCGHSYNAPDAYAGKRAKCKSCKQSFTVPNGGTIERAGSVRSNETKPKSSSLFARMPLALKAALGLCVIALASYGIYDSMPSIGEWERANTERKRLNQKMGEQQSERFAKVVAELGNTKVEQPAVDQTTAKPNFVPGEDILLQSKDGSSVDVFSTQFGPDEVAQHQLRKDVDGYVLMVKQGRVLSTASGTRAKYLSSDVDTYEVRIKSGRHDTKSGWVRMYEVVKVQSAVPAAELVAAHPASTPLVPVAGQPAPAQHWAKARTRAAAACYRGRNAKCRSAVEMGE